MRRTIALGLCLVFTAAFVVGFLAIPAHAYKVVKDCQTIYQTSTYKYMCCIVEDYDQQVSYEECFYFVPSAY